ncbi:MAG: hypothetical protein K8R18_03825 [Parvibaculum sp.]|uniref:hypothetical protein n=1 Tax=Parvibaculum sp. TaxID=2024848 RepID=UPI0025D07881|nr:hypothetical protein [Parvibaculum sp.]MCE9648736.1 hypothetical protein [Parvibaculum sp.]
MREPLLPMSTGTTPTTSAARARAVARAMQAVGRLERLPKWLNLLPMVAQWVWLSARYRSATLPSAANPAITSGGLAGEGKLEYFACMGPTARAATAPHTYVVNRGVTSLAEAEAAMAAAGLAYPLIAKPDIGWCGFGVRLVRDEAELAEYLARFPDGERVILQRFVPYDGEAGLYYMRYPDEPAGRLTGLLLRSHPRVVGDGAHSIAELIAADARLRRLGRDGSSEACCDTRRIPAVNEIVRVSITGSTRVGGLYRDASAAITPAMTEAIDAIARDMPDFHLGRFDVRYESMGALRAGKGFSIIEVNGAGSEAVHAWDPRLTLREAYGIVFEKQRQIFALGDAMRKRGHRPIGVTELARLYRRQQWLIRRYPRSN